MTNNLLASNVEALGRQLEWLNRSYVKCRKIGVKKEYSVSDFDKFETLSSRFARSIDFLVRRVFRSLDDVEFESQGSLIDVVNNAYKRGLFESMEEIGQMRDLRNDIVHEYLDEDLSESFAELLEVTPKLIEIVKRTIRYSDRYIQ